MTLNVLTVDDSLTMRNMLKMVLQQAGYHVCQAEDGMHGLEVLKTVCPDVIITDINMPRMDGFGFIEAVRSTTQYRSTPMIVLSTEFDTEKKTRARNAGASGWIIKPFDPEKLISAIRRVVA